MKKLSKAFLPIMFASTMMCGSDMQYGYEDIKRPKQNVVFVHKDPHQDKGVCSKKIRKGAGKRLSRSKRKEKANATQLGCTSKLLFK